jgi:lipoprotein-anchoring transpeptidase ErfK/SrfK
VRPRTLPAAPTVPPGPLGARILRRTQLRTSPGGRAVTTVGRYTSFRSRQVLAVVARRGDWLGVLSEHVSNARTAWIPAASAELVHEPYRLEVDLSARRLIVRREGRIVRRVRVAIGRPEVPTPIGRFAVTDALRIGGGSGAYGCCALALTARQPHVAQGWTGGDRIAIHGTSDEDSIGTPASGGCLRARDADMRWMLGRVTLGAEVRIRA